MPYSLGDLSSHFQSGTRANHTKFFAPIAKHQIFAACAGAQAEEFYASFAHVLIDYRHQLEGIKFHFVQPQ